MKKIILGLLLVVIVAVGGGVYYVLNNLDNLVKAAIEKHGSAATQTAVRVESVKIDLLEGSGGISGLTIANTSGFAMPYAFSLGEIRTGIDLKSLEAEPYVISEITVLAPQVFVEINEDNKTNLNEIKNNLMAGVPTGSKAKPETEPADSTKAEPRLIIRRITFADGNINARVAALDNKEYQLKLPKLDMTDIGGTKGATPAELANEILTRLTDKASERVKKKIIDEKLGELKAKAQAKIDAKKAEAEAKIAEEKARLKAEADAKMDEKKEKAKDKLKGLFGK
jgi:uncharacterized protein involved in outer membrane biogenesis